MNIDQQETDKKNPKTNDISLVINKSNPILEKKDEFEDSNEVLEAVELNNIEDNKEMEKILEDDIKIQRNDEKLNENKNNKNEKLITFFEKNELPTKSVIKEEENSIHNEIENIVIDVRNNNSNITLNNGN